MLAAAAAAVVLLTAADMCSSAGARAAAAPTRVSVTISRSRIAFSPSYVPTGAVLFRVRNRTRATRDFGLGVRRTRAIAAGRSATLAMTIARRGERTFSSRAAARAGRLTGPLYLFLACTHPAATTVQVQIGRSVGGLTLSPSSVPCGSVTFVVTDTDTPGEGLLVSSTVPPHSGLTPTLSPGETASMTLHFAAKGIVRCDGVQDDAEGDPVIDAAGTLTLL